MTTTENTIFRFKFTNEFNNELLSFSKIHQFDDRHTYKDAWTRWLDNNSTLIETETNNMILSGYTGNVLDKMYKSGRYYFRKKGAKQEPRKRRQYVSIDKDIIEYMDNHIAQSSLNTDFKPSTSYAKFTEEYASQISEETDRLVTENLTKTDILSKFKKTYKNRYFLFTSNNISDNISDITED